MKTKYSQNYFALEKIYKNLYYGRVWVDTIFKHNLSKQNKRKANL